MKRISACLIIILFLASCVKDRIPPVATPTSVPTSDTTLYFWSFNGADSSHHGPDWGVDANAHFKYYSSYIDYTTGTSVNLPTGSDSGSCLRVRNPSDSIIFYMPTTGYDSISFSFAEQRSSSGPSQNAIYYTTDGVSYISAAITNNVYTVDTLFMQHVFDLSSDINVKHNSKFAVKIVFTNNHTGSSGNDRFDNVALYGIKK